MSRIAATTACVCSSLVISGCGAADAGETPDDSGILGSESQPALGLRKSSACTPEFRPLGRFPNPLGFSVATDVSASGLFVTGYSFVDFTEAFRYAGGALQRLGLPEGARSSSGFGISADGSVIAGLVNFQDRDEAYLWRGTEATALGFLSEVRSSFANDVSDDGKVVVGSAGVGDHASEAFRWEARTGMVGLGMLDGVSSAATGVDRHGSSVTGDINYDSAPGQAFLWRRGSGMQGLGYPDGYSGSATEGLSSNGKVVVGSLNVGAEAYPARWSKKHGWQQLASVPGDARAASRDGSVVVGIAVDPELLTKPLIWDEVNGARYLDDVLTAAGIPMPGFTFLEATGVSADGKVVVGIGVRDNWFVEGWMACVPQGGA